MSFIMMFSCVVWTLITAPSLDFTRDWKCLRQFDSNRYCALEPPILFEFELGISWVDSPKSLLCDLRVTRSSIEKCWETFSWLEADGCSWCQIAQFASEWTVGLSWRYPVLSLLQPRFWCWFRICYHFWRRDKPDGHKCPNIAENGTFSVFRVFCTDKFVPWKRATAVR